jgi:hypothetical protein
VPDLTDGFGGLAIAFVALFALVALGILAVVVVLVVAIVRRPSSGDPLVLRPGDLESNRILDDSARASGLFMAQQQQLLQQQISDQVIQQQIQANLNDPHH